MSQRIKIKEEYLLACEIMEDCDCFITSDNRYWKYQLEKFSQGGAFLSVSLIIQEGWRRINHDECSENFGRGF